MSGVERLDSQTVHSRPSTARGSHLVSDRVGLCHASRWVYVSSGVAQPVLFVQLTASPFNSASGFQLVN